MAHGIPRGSIGSGIPACGKQAPLCLRRCGRSSDRNSVGRTRLRPRTAYQRQQSCLSWHCVGRFPPHPLGNIGSTLHNRAARRRKILYWVFHRSAGTLAHIHPPRHRANACRQHNACQGRRSCQPSQCHRRIGRLGSTVRPAPPGACHSRRSRGRCHPTSAHR